MAFLSSLNISGSALTANKLRMEIISQNLANSATSGPQAYKRKLVVFSERLENEDFSASLQNAIDGRTSFNGVEVSAIIEDNDAFKLEYDPTNPLANEEGYVQIPDINTVEEMVDMITASRSYEANVTAFNAVKDMAAKALELGK